MVRTTDPVQQLGTHLQHTVLRVQVRVELTFQTSPVHLPHLNALWVHQHEFSARVVARMKKPTCPDSIAPLHNAHMNDGASFFLTHEHACISLLERACVMLMTGCFDGATPIHFKT